ncbi:MAG: hypothetical protein J7647_05270 [Cyanobacteria bacterium SBLK]|nr:hypothetical protein [Cyanobacteria bacterium SBLK]
MSLPTWDFGIFTVLGESPSRQDDRAIAFGSRKPQWQGNNDCFNKRYLDVMGSGRTL